MTERPAQVRKILRIEAFLITYNVLEAAAAVTFGILAASIALVGFGLDSVIEVCAAVIIVWRFRLEMAGRDTETAEHRAHRMIGVTFFALAAYVSYESVMTLVQAEAPDTSLPGIVVAALSALIMPVFGIWKLRLAQQVGSAALRADAKETLVCSYLSFALLLGLGLNLLADWWWADPVAALAMVPLMLKEGWEGVRGECC